MKRMNTILVAACSGALLAGCASQVAAPKADAAAPVVESPKPVYLTNETSAATPAAAEISPATQPALPAGHPQLPAGHPQLPAGHPQLPAGHPQMGQPGQGLPAGHPSIEQLRAMATTRPVTYGKVTIKAQQATANGPVIGADKAAIEIYENNELVKTLPVQLGPDGTGTIDNVPFGGNYDQLAKVTHEGVDFSGYVDPRKDTQAVTVPVYETTEQEPAWQVKMRHIIVQPAEKAIQVIEVLAVENPTDRAWIGKADSAGNHTTFSLQLPVAAHSVEFGGSFHDCCTKIEGTKVITSMALLPGVHKYEVGYLLPDSKGRTELTATAPALVKNMMVIVPEGMNATAEGLNGPQEVNMGRGVTRFFRGSDIPAGKTIKLTFASAPEATHGAQQHTANTSAVDSAQLARVIAGAGGLLVLIVGGSFMFFRAPRMGKKDRK